MNKIERYIYDKLKENPKLKNSIVNVYQRICSVVPFKKVDSEYEMEVREGYFYGFHDKCPWSPDNKMLLAHKFNIPLRMPKPKDAVEVGYFTGSNYMNFKVIGTAKSWNWQMGAMLQWVGISNNIIFNDFNGNHHIARIVTPDGKLVATLPLPIVAISSNGAKALSYSFERLRKYASAYAYANGIDPEEAMAVSKNSGLDIIDIRSLEITKLFSIAEIASYHPEQSMDGAYHYFTHCLFSPSGKRFVFFHRWVSNNRIRTRMLSSDLKGKDLFIFPTSGMVSHIAWQDDENILAYARTEEFDDKYYLFRDRKKQFSIIGENHFKSDGHPQFSTDKKWILTDTYPDRFRTQYLILYNVKDKRIYNIAKLRSPFKYRYNLRCDLHPRWNRNSSMVCFDSAHAGIRSLYTIELE